MSTSEQQFDYRGRDRLLGELSRDCRPMLDALSELALPSRQYRSHQMAYVGSEAPKLLAAARALPREASDDEIRAVADAINPLVPSGEVISWRLKRKSSKRGYRPVCELPPVVKAEHYLVRDLVCAAMPTARHIFDIRGRGTLAAIAAIRDALEGGYDWCWVGDIRDCFQSVDADALIHRLPLPRSITSKWLDYRNLTFSPEPMVDNALSSSVLYVAEAHRRNRPRGLLQGSPASNSILALLFASMADVFALHECVPCLFADNLFVAAKSEAARDAVVSEISAYLSAHPAGRFRLHKVRYLSPGDRFEALGWAFTRGAHGIGIEPTDAAVERMFGKLADAEGADILQADGTYDHVQRVVNGYRGSFRGWEEADLLLDGALMRAEAFVERATAIRGRVGIR